MKDILMQSVFFGMFLTLFSYQIGSYINKKTRFCLANPLLIAVILIVSVLTLFYIDYDSYRNGAKYIQCLLTPATVSLAVPVYRQLELLKTYPKAIFVAIAVGVLTAMCSIFLLSLLLGLTHEQYITLLPKSITTAIGMGISEKQGGMASITIVAISITGITGTVGAEIGCRLFGIRNPIAKGLAIGTAAHALGTSRAIQMGEVEGAMSSLAVVIAGVLTILAVPFFGVLI